MNTWSIGSSFGAPARPQYIFARRKKRRSGHRQSSRAEPAENALRPIVPGRSPPRVFDKNWRLAGVDHGGRTGAVLASLVATCERHGVDPVTYLKDVLTRIAETPVGQLDQLLPHRWKAAHAENQDPTT